MAKVDMEIPNDVLSQFEKLDSSCENIFGEMCRAGAEAVHKNVVANMQRSFASTKSLEKGLKITKVYKTPSDDGINVHIGFYGYDTSKASKKNPKGTPIPLIAMAREYGTSHGEQKKPFFRKSFKKKEIESAMLEIQDKYIKGD